jgi:hypothetical protein
MLEASTMSLRTEEFSARIAELAQWRVLRDSGVVTFHKGVLRALDHLQYLKRVRLDLIRLLQGVPTEGRHAVLLVHRELLEDGLRVLGSFMTRVNIKTAQELSPAVARQVETRRREAMENLRSVHALTDRILSELDGRSAARHDYPLPSRTAPSKVAKVIPLFARP